MFCINMAPVTPGYTCVGYLSFAKSIIISIYLAGESKGFVMEMVGERYQTPAVMLVAVKHSQAVLTGRSDHLGDLQSASL